MLIKLPKPEGEYKIDPVGSRDDGFCPYCGHTVFLGWSPLPQEIGECMNKCGECGMESIHKDSIQYKVK